MVRLSGQLCVRPAGGRWRRLAELPLQPGQTRTLGWCRLTKQHDYGWLYVVAHWAVGHEEPWFLVTTQPATRATLRRYLVRMWTEELYGDLKGHGFDLQATHLRDPDRLSRLVLAVCWVFVWYMTLGSWVIKNGKRAQIDVKSRRDKSYFRLGWDWINECLRHGAPLRLWFHPYFAK